MNKIKTNTSKVLFALTMVFAIMISIMPLNVFAEDSIDLFESGVVHTATDWTKVQELIDNANANDTIDISALKAKPANVTLEVSKNIKIRREATGEAFYAVCNDNLFFSISNNATLMLENVMINSSKLDTSIIKGTGNVVVSKSTLSPDTANNVVTVYFPPATIDVVGDVTVMTDGVWDSCIVAGSTIIERNSNKQGKAGTAIKAINVNVNGGFVHGGSSFESGCDSGDAIEASGNVTINGVYQEENLNSSNARIQGGSVGVESVNTTVGLPIRFTDNASKQRVLSVQDAIIYGSNKSKQGISAPYTVKMSAMDIAIIDNSKIGWYTDIPLFSEGFFSVTNPVKTWGTFDKGNEIFQLISVNATLLGTKTITNGQVVNHYAPKDAQITITADAPSIDKEFDGWNIASGQVELENSSNASTTFKMPSANVEISANYKSKHIHNASETWSKDITKHWNECIDADGHKMNIDFHTFGEWVIDTNATETVKGSKHKECTVCNQIETVEIPTLLPNNPTTKPSPPQTDYSPNIIFYIVMMVLSASVVVRDQIRKK